MVESNAPRVVGDIMTRKLITMSPDDSLDKIEEGMKRYRFRHLPVVDGEGKLVGIVSHRDILAASSSIFSSDAARRNEIIHRQGRVEMLMHREVTTVTEDETLVRVGELMWNKKIGCVCVVDDDNKLIGIVTEADFVKLASTLLRTLWEGSIAPPAWDPSKDSDLDIS